MSEKELNEALSQTGESIIKGLQALGQLIHELVTDMCDAIDEIISTFDIEKIVSSIKKQDVKYDKNISHFKYISERDYDNPCYKIEPKARTQCRK